MFESGQRVKITMLDEKGGQVVKFNLQVLDYDDGLLKVFLPGAGAKEGPETVYNLRSSTIISVEVMKEGGA